MLEQARGLVAYVLVQAVPHSHQRQTLGIDLDRPHVVHLGGSSSPASCERQGVGGGTMAQTMWQPDTGTVGQLAKFAILGAGNGIW
jgi:hypothetical protein